MIIMDEFTQRLLSKSEVNRRFKAELAAVGLPETASWAEYVIRRAEIDDPDPAA